MYIADLTEVLVERKHLQQPATDWVLCLADLSFALPLDKTVASLEGKSELALVKRQFAAEYGLRAADRVGGDPNSSMFKRANEPATIAARLAMPGDFAGTYKVSVAECGCLEPILTQSEISRSTQDWNWPTCAHSRH